MKKELVEAVKKGNAGEVRRILKSKPELARSTLESGTSLPLLARYYGKPEIGELLFEAGAPVGMAEACAFGKKDRVRDLLKANRASASEMSADGFPMLGLAAFFGNEEIGEMLIDAGADVNVSSRNAQNVAPIHSAVAARSARLVRKLIKAGADVNRKQEKAVTALHSAAMLGDLEIVRLLIEAGADREAASTDQKRAADYAREGGWGEVVKLLEG